MKLSKLKMKRILIEMGIIPCSAIDYLYLCQEIKKLEKAQY